MAQTGSIKAMGYRGYAWVEPDDGSETVFVHVRNNPDLTEAARGDQVSYDIMHGNKGTNLKVEDKIDVTSSLIELGRLVAKLRPLAKAGRHFRSLQAAEDLVRALHHDFPGVINPPTLAPAATSPAAAMSKTTSPHEKRFPIGTLVRTVKEIICPLGPYGASVGTSGVVVKHTKRGLPGDHDERWIIDLELTGQSKKARKAMTDEDGPFFLMCEACEVQGAYDRGPLALMDIWRTP